MRPATLRGGRSAEKRAPPRSGRGGALRLVLEGGRTWRRRRRRRRRRNRSTPSPTSRQAGAEGAGRVGRIAPGVRFVAVEDTVARRDRCRRARRSPAARRCRSARRRSAGRRRRWRRRRARRPPVASEQARADVEEIAALVTVAASALDHQVALARRRRAAISRSMRGPTPQALRLRERHLLADDRRQVGGEGQHERLDLAALGSPSGAVGDAVLSGPLNALREADAVDEAEHRVDRCRRGGSRSRAPGRP